MSTIPSYDHLVSLLAVSNPSMFGSKEISLSWFLKSCIYAACAPLLVYTFSYVPLQTTPTVSPEVSTPLSIVLVGDIMIDRGVERSVQKNFDGDYRALFAHTPYIAKADIAFGNLEGPVAIGGRNVGSRFSFRMNPQALHTVKDAGFDMLSLANNHMGDYAQEAFVETLRNLEREQLLYVGAGNDYADATSVRIIEVKGIKVGFLAATDVGPTWLKATSKHPGVVLASDPLFSDHIERAKSRVDVLVVSFHFGDEYAPSNKRQELLAHASIDAGADVVVGHHPHVMQRIEIYKNKPIFYSLGNFIFDQYFSEHTLRGMTVTLSIDRETKAITYTPFISPMSKAFIPQERVPFDSSFLLQKRFFP